jgi:hypothetical protein
MSYISFQPKDYFNTVLYTGNASTNAITGVGFQPDWTWIKRRNATASHAIQDAVRGNDKSLRSHTTGAEYTNTFFSSFDTDGFTVTSSESDVNASAGTYASWNWKANGQGSSNTDGSINTTYTSASTTSGVSISQYTGTGANATVGHGLGVAPKVVMIKNLSRAEDWLVGHNSIGFTKFLSLNLTNASQAVSNRFNDTAPTNQVFSVGTSDGSNKSGDSHVAYCFTPIRGFSAMGSYIGNGSNNGSYIHLGLKPAFIIIKKDATDSWFMYDNKRGDINTNAKTLKADSNGAEGTSGKEIDFLSNGVKIRNSNNSINTSGSTYIYMAFAEEPLVSSNGVPATAK